MFSRFIATVAVVALASSVLAKPIDVSRRSISFSGWHGISSLSGFDNFFGEDNFSSSLNVQTVEQQNVLVCHTQEIEVIQQQLAILIENAKRIVTQQICEVETQTIVLSQVQAQISSFSEDVRHVSSRHASFDSSVAGHISNLFDESGNLNNNNFGFSGSDIGSHSVVFAGTNWNPTLSPASVSQAFSDSQSAF